MHASFNSLRAGCHAPGALHRLLLTFTLVGAGVLAAVPTRAAGPLPPSEVPVAFAFNGGGAGSGHRLTGWLTFNAATRGTIDPVAGTGTYDVAADPQTRLSLVITDTSTGMVTFVGQSEGFAMRIECVNAASSSFRISAKGNLAFNFLVQGPLGSLFTGLQLPEVAPMSTDGSWNVATPLTHGFWSGDEFSYASGEETAALLALLEAANAQVTTLTTDLENAQGDLKLLLLDAKRDAAQLVNANDQIASLTAELGTANGQVSQLTAELATANGQITELTTELADTGSELKNLQLDAKRNAAALNNAQLQIAQLTTDLAAAQTQASQLATELSAANARVAQLTGERDAAQGELKILKRDYQLVSIELNKTQAMADRLTAALEAANSQTASLTAELATARADASRAQAEIQQWQDALRISQAQNAGLRAVFDSQAASFNRIGTAIANANKETSFRVPGATVGDQMANLAAAIEQLNPGQLKALRTELAGGKK